MNLNLADPESAIKGRVTIPSLDDVRVTSVTSEVTSDRNNGSRVAPYRACAPYGDNGVPGSQCAAVGFL